MSINDKRRFAVHKAGLEGVIVLLPQGNGDTAMIDKAATHGDIPEWADNEHLIGVDLKEHREWYTERAGEEMYLRGDPARGIQPIGGLDIYEQSDFKWDAVDEEGDVVQIMPHYDTRSIKLANLLGLKPELDAKGDQTGNIKDLPSGAWSTEVAETYHEIEGLSAETLAELKDLGFGSLNELGEVSEEQDKKTAQG